VRSHHAPAALLAHFHRIDRLSDCPDLIYLQQQSIACFLIDGRLHTGDIGHGEVVPNHLRLYSDLRSECGPPFPVVLVEGVFDRDDWKVFAKLYVKCCELGTRFLQ